MQIHGLIHQFPKEIKLLILAFICTLSIGFFGGISFVRDTTNSNPTGIEERYLGNEDVEEATTMKFKKSAGEIKTTVHNHILSLSVIFFLLAVIVSTTSINKKLKLFLMIEPFISIICTFGGIYLMWTGITWMKYIIMISGLLMTLSFGTAVLMIFSQIISKKKLTLE
ncbi:hypothetical protein RRF68_02110 [Tenacibaculum sp. HL-MS23]|uniref:hypothetical protein n=1 Tax=unclassified Tenacibaculum TaxID=2635139 RepID=UPI001C4E5E30|nr:MULTISPECIES: hypothetical protein [unclassified Tenacibaculum]QXP73954.1 hypothetical protein H0I30_02090 [Tenacibaculum sp. AHE14PA]QXP75679.1 hypothetical protein H0I31_10890 [Tenacibaculum sp. AHE15PA]WNW02237.1 hypothetical protein RRF68_02110 [Tenacibaculum sp. HL-MS23]